jgi:uncharacterized protein (DUF2235 family)
MPSPKRIAVLLDGTWNTVDDDTNVWRMKSLCVTTAANQLVYYSAGVGTQFGAKVRGGLYGYGLNDEITDAYKWLIDNYEAGDELFMFGFRGCPEECCLPIRLSPTYAICSVVAKLMLTAC